MEVQAWMMDRISAGFRSARVRLWAGENVRT